MKCHSLKEFPICYPPRNECELPKVLEEAGVECAFSYGPREFGEYRLLGIGFRGVVFLARFRGEVVAVKVPRTDRVYDMREEALNQKLAYPLSPFVYDHSKHYIIMEYIPYPDILEIVEKGSEDEIKEAICKVLRAGFELDMRGIDHGELVRPWDHVKVGEKRVVFIDFNSSSRKRKPSNLTSLVSGLLLKPSPPASRLSQLLGVNKAELIELLRRYKRGFRREAFEEIFKRVCL